VTPAKKRTSVQDQNGKSDGAHDECISPNPPTDAGTPGERVDVFSPESEQAVSRKVLGGRVHGW